MIETLVQTQIYYEIAMSIGNSLDLRKMLKESLSAYLRKLSCSAGIVVEMKQETEGSFRLVPVFSIPRNASIIPTCQAGLQHTPEIISESALAALRDKLPIDGQDDQGRFFYLMDLPGFGLLLLVRSAKPLDQTIVQSIERLNSKLADACIACLQNDRIARINQELVRQIQHRVHVEAEMKKVLGELEQRVEERTVELSTSNAALRVEISERKRANDQLNQEIIERKQAEEKVREQVGFLETLFDTIPNPIFHKDANGRYTGCNRAFWEFIGKPIEEILGKTVYDMGDKDITDKYEEKDRELFEHTGKQHYEWQVQNTRGEVREVIFDKATLLDASAAVSGLIGVITDITDLKRAEAERARLEAENRELQKAESLGRMAGAIAHLFNNYLAAVIGNLELALMDFSVGAAIRKNLIGAMQAAHRSAEISGMMLTYLGQSQAKRDPLDLSDICRQSLPMLQDAMPEGIALKTDLLSSGPVVRVHVNEVQQVLTQLITNGWESIGRTAGTVTLATRIIPASEIPKSHLVPIDWKPVADAFASIEVTDTGCGIAEEDMDKIFDPFYTTKFTGRGMGLAVVLGIVKTWGGAIGVDSKKDQGSVFIVLLPLVTDELPRLSQNTTPTHQMEPGGTVLLVDDQDAA